MFTINTFPAESCCISVDQDMCGRPHKIKFFFETNSTIKKLFFSESLEVFLVKGTKMNILSLSKVKGTKAKLIKSVFYSPRTCIHAWF